jgi:threonine/homoserine/homoserine lactone efflux protein
VAHTLLAVLGLTALLYASETLFNLIQYAGAAYLFYLGIMAIRSKSLIVPTGDRQRMTSDLNPKGILLFFSYFPQFVTPDAADVTRQLFFDRSAFYLDVRTGIWRVRILLWGNR